MDNNETVVISRAQFENWILEKTVLQYYDQMWESFKQEAEKSRTTPDDQPLDQGGSSVDSNNSALSRRSEREQRIDHWLNRSFTTAVSDADGTYYVQVRFDNLADMHECHRAFLNLPSASVKATSNQEDC